MNHLLKELRISLMATVSLAILLCGIYPWLVWEVGQGMFPEKSSGSLVRQGNKVIGSSLISQRFSHAQYFHPRPSSAGEGHDATSSGGSNLGPTSKRLVEETKQRIADYRTENGLAPGTLIPADAVTTSASGLDPHISVKNARLQAPRVARVRGLSEKTVLKQIEVHTEGRDLGILGEERVNVLLLNVALDSILR
jgi:potassium-transporting ATPase KdpC subunit